MRRDRVAYWCIVALFLLAIIVHMLQRIPEKVYVQQMMPRDMVRLHLLADEVTVQFKCKAEGIKAGDRVDVLAVMRPGQHKGEPFKMLLVENLRVLAVDDDVVTVAMPISDLPAVAWLRKQLVVQKKK